MAYYNWKQVRDLMLEKRFISSTQDMEKVFMDHGFGQFEWTGDYDCDMWTLTSIFIRQILGKPTTFDEINKEEKIKDNLRYTVGKLLYG